MNSQESFLYYNIVYFGLLQTSFESGGAMLLTLSLSMNIRYYFPSSQLCALLPSNAIKMVIIVLNSFMLQLWL